MIHLTNSLFLIPIDDLILPGIIFVTSIISAYFIDYYSRKTILRFKTKDNAPLRLPIFLFVISLGLNLIVYLDDDLLSSQISYLQTLSQLFTIVIAAILLNRISKSSLADSSVKRKMDVFSLRILQKMSTLSIGFISFWIIVGLFGFFHGLAHGLEMPQAANPILFALGFIVGTSALHLFGVIIGYFSIQNKISSTFLRIIGFGFACFGFYSLILFL